MKVGSRGLAVTERLDAELEFAVFGRFGDLEVFVFLLPFSASSLSILLVDGLSGSCALRRSPFLS